MNWKQVASEAIWAGCLAACVWAFAWCTVANCAHVGAHC